jgi:DNA-binding winged helix-turn-helix (wHTH) protein
MNLLKSTPDSADASGYEFGSFRIDARERLLFRDGERVVLTAKTYETLLLLVRNAGRVVEKRELMDALWPDAVVEENNLNQQISAVRKILGERPDEGRYIKTIPGRGYRFVAEVRASRPAGSPAVERNRGVPKAAIIAAAVAVLALIAFLVSRNRHPGIRSIAVLPFKSLGARGDDYLGLGLTDVLITRLTNLGGVVVRPTSAVRPCMSIRSSTAPCSTPAIACG